MDKLLVDLLRTAARDHPDREAIVVGDDRVTYRELDISARGAATALADLGVAPRDVVALTLANSAEYLVAYLAAGLIGAVATGINPRLGPRERETILARCAPKVVVADAAQVRAWSTTEPLPHHSPRLCRDPREPLAIVWTSGTTGVPKGAVFTLDAMVAVARGTGELNMPGDRRLSPLPFAHVGFMTRLVDELQNATTTVVTPTPWRATDALHLLEHERITVGQGVPAQWAMMLADPTCDEIDASHLRVIGTGAAAVAPELVRSLRMRFGCPVLVRYTSTEAALTTGTRIGDPDEVTCNTVGRSQPGVEIRVVGPDGAPVPVGTVGEIHSRSAAQMSGYWNDAEATAATLDNEGWIHTADLGALDVAGNLTFRGRNKEMYIRGGYNVYPIEVENVLMEHAAVARAAVVATPDERLGEVGVAFVEFAPGHERPTLAQIREWVGEQLADYKRPDALVDGTIPLTAMMKPDKAALAPLAADARRRVASSSTSRPSQTKVVDAGERGH